MVLIVNVTTGTVATPLFGIWIGYWNDHHAMKVLILKGRVKFDVTSEW